MSKILKTTVEIARIVIISLICLLVLIFLVTKIFNMKLYVVLDSTMDPEYPLGSLIYVKDVDLNTLDVGDVITYKVTNNVVATHRITEAVLLYGENERVFATKGDMSEEADPDLVIGSEVIGVPVFTIPKIGNLILWVKYPPGSYIAIGVGVFLAVFVFFSDNLIALISREKKATKTTKKR